MNWGCLFGRHVYSVWRRNGSRLLGPFCPKCGKKRPHLEVESAEASRMTGLRGMPVERRQAAIDELLRNAK